MNWKEWIAKNGLTLLAGTLTIAATIANGKKDDKAMDDKITEKVNKAFTNKLKES